VGSSIADRVPLAVIGRTGKKALFAAVLQPVLKGKQRTVTSVMCKPRPGLGASIRVQRGRRTDTVSVSPSGRIAVARDGKAALP
jgi:hypothetical protein